MSTTQTSYEVTKTFNSSREMKASAELSAGMMCETLGFYEKGDGGGARYAIEAKGDAVANDMDIIAIGTDNTLVAKYLYEGKPVNVLQFGAINTYTTEKPGYIPYYKNNETGGEIDSRDDQPAIQRAIDYTHDRLISYEEHNVNGVEQHCYKNAINTIVIPEGNYVIKTQIKLPPYMQFYLTGVVQFFSVMKSFLNSKGAVKLTQDGIFDPINSFFDVPEKAEIFVKNDFYAGETKLKLSNSDNEYYVYKHGTIKICYKYDDNGNPINPYKTKDKDRYAVNPSVNSEIFCGNGSLTIKNNTEITKDGGNTYTSPYYTCAIEIGNAEENIRYWADESTILSYENLRFNNLKIRNFHIGILSNAHSFYSNVISNTEFFENDIAFQFGVYGESDVFSDSSIIGLKSINCGEMNHFRDCVFTGNKISVNILISGLSASFTSCHFDFDNCVFRAAYRTNLTVDKCHIEGIGKALKDKYFPNGAITSTTAFQARAEDDPLNEFVGIIYAKPLTRFNQSQVDQYSYVDLNITSSRIIDTYDMPWSLFSYYNSGDAKYSDGHFRSRFYLNNNKYAYANNAPISFLTTEDNGIVHSGFLLSEFPETDKVNDDENDKMRFEKYACQNIPVISRDSSKYGSFLSAEKPHGNHRFLSNRTLENKYPYFQNVESNDNGFSGISVKVENIGDSEISLFKNGWYSNYNPFSAYVGNEANCFRFKNVYIVSDNPEDVKNLVQPYVSFSLNNDIIKCEQGDTISTALVSDIISFNSIYNRIADNTYEEKQTPLFHRVRFVEILDDVEKAYSYDISSNINTQCYNCFDFDYPSTSTCTHIVKNREAKNVRIEFDFYIPVIIGPEIYNSPSYTSLHAVLVEKNK